MVNGRYERHNRANNWGDVYGPSPGGSPSSTTSRGSGYPSSSHDPQGMWRDENGVPRSEFGSVENIPDPSLDALVWPKEFQKDRFFRKQGGTKPGPDDTMGDFASLGSLRRIIRTN